jgi:chemotaxis protein methyltransferase CheR
VDQDEFRFLQGLLLAHTGLLFADENAFLLERRLRPRLEELSLLCFRDYCRYLIDPSLEEAARQRELDEIFERVATRETYFFREAYQLTAFRTEILPELHRLRRPRRRLTIWSAGCSTGEEVYTIAIELLRSGLFAERGWDVRITGSDLSETALRAALAGRYGPSSFRQTDAEVQERYFERAPDGQWRVRPEVAALVSFVRLNLHRPDWTALLDHGAPFDVIFCRNVIIYFDRAARPPIIRRFHDHLSPGGYLLLGHSESLIDMQTPFQLHHLSRELVYKKPS